MSVIHLRRRQIALLTALFLMILGTALLLTGCLHRASDTSDMPVLSDAEQRIAYLKELGWEVAPDAVETLDLELPQPFNEAWERYAQLQTAQGFPFSDYAGATVQRYTYAITNYPDIEKGVQANLYLCDNLLIGGDIIFTGQGGFQKGLKDAIPAKE